MVRVGLPLSERRPLLPTRTAGRYLRAFRVGETGETLGQAPAGGPAPPRSGRCHFLAQHSARQGTKMIKNDAQRHTGTGGGRVSSGAAAEPLVAYFADIAHIPTLSREEQMLAAKELEEATRVLQQALYQIPWVAQEVVSRWSRRRTAGLATRKLSEAFGDGEAEAGERLDRALARVERALARRPATSG